MTHRATISVVPCGAFRIIQYSMYSCHLEKGHDGDHNSGSKTWKSGANSKADSLATESKAGERQHEHPEACPVCDSPYCEHSDSEQELIKKAWELGFIASRLASTPAQAQRDKAIDECAWSVKSIGIEDLKAAGLGYVIANDASSVLGFVEKRLLKLKAAALAQPQAPQEKSCDCGSLYCGEMTLEKEKREAAQPQTVVATRCDSK